MSQSNPASGPKFESLEVGQVVVEQELQLSRDSLVQYAGASGDFNPIHYRDDVAESVGLPGVLAHGMLTMGLAVQPLLSWIGNPGKLLSYQTRFSRPIVVDPKLGAELKISAKVSALNSETRVAKFELSVIFEEKPVLGKAFVELQF